MGASPSVTAVASGGSATSGRTGPLAMSNASDLRRRLGLTAAVVGAFAATVVVLALTSTIVARVG